MIAPSSTITQPIGLAPGLRPGPGGGNRSPVLQTSIAFPTQLLWLLSECSSCTSKKRAADAGTNLFLQDIAARRQAGFLGCVKGESGTRFGRSLTDATEAVGWGPAAAVLIRVTLLDTDPV